jgi:hypothetical protein
MLKMRARSWTLRDGFADVLRGLHIREEVDDFIEIRGPSPASTPDPVSFLHRPRRPIAPRPARPPSSANASEAARFREANAALETRLRTKFPERMVEIDAIYDLALRPE